MTEFNIKNSNSIEENYELGLLPQRNSRDLYYRESSCRSGLTDFLLSSENRRILRKTEQFKFELIPIEKFTYTPQLQKQLIAWIKELGWEFPTSSIKTIFTNHIFNYIYKWFDEEGNIIAYSVCYFSDNISHIAYVFYHPQYNHSNLPIRLVLQAIIDSQEQGLKYCYLGRFSENTGYYKRNMPGFQFFDKNSWIDYNKSKLLYRS